MGEFVRVEVEDGVATIRVDRPKMNALNKQVQEEIRAAAAECTDRDDIKSVVVWGGERVFAAGADVKEMADMSYTDMVRRSGGLQSAFTAVAKIPKPVVAAVNGYALGGGCELAMCADIRIAADNAVLGQPEILLGIIPGAGGTQRLPRLIGEGRALEMIMTGRTLWRAPGARGPGISQPKSFRDEAAQQSLPAVFNRAGYDTMRTCKIGNSYEAANRLFTVRKDATKRGGTSAPGTTAISIACASSSAAPAPTSPMRSWATPPPTARGAAGHSRSSQRISSGQKGSADHRLREKRRATRHRGFQRPRRRVEPGILLCFDQLRSAVEPDADRATDRPDSTHWTASSRGRDL